MKVKNQINSSIISAAVAMLSPYVPDLTPTSLIAALQDYDSASKPGASDPGARPQKPYTVMEAAKLLGVSKPTVYRMFEDGVLTKVKVRNSTRIPAEDIARIISGD